MSRKLTVNDGRPLIPEELITGLPYWNDLSREDQQIVMEGTQKAGRLRYSIQASNLELGEVLVVLHKHLKEHFRAHMKKLNIKERTAYRIIEYFEEVKKHVPVEALPTLMARGYDLAKKKYFPIMRKIGKPESSDPVVVESWAERVIDEQKAKMRTSKNGQGEVLPPETPRDPEDMLEESFRYAKVRFHKLPHSKNRMKWLERLFGYMLKEAGVSSPVSFSPMTAPENFLTGRGRPKLDS